MTDSNAKKLAQLLDANGDVKLDNLDNINVYDEDTTSTGYFDLPQGTTAQRPTASEGQIRFNTTLNLAEYYDGTTWKSIDSPPTVSSINPTNIADSDSDVDIVITGSNFLSSPTVIAIGEDGSEITPTTVVRDSSTQITATFDGTDFSDAQEDYDIKVTNTSGLASTLADALAVNASPVWTVASGSLGVFNNSERTGISITTGATDSEGASLTYAVASGSLPTGLSLNTSTGAITGDADAVGSDTTSNFTLSVTDGTNTVTRAYSIEIKAPALTSYTSTGSGTYSVPSGVTAVDVLVVAGGGGGGSGHPGSDHGGGGGGAGGLIYRPAFHVTPGGSVPYTVGLGGGGNPQNGPYPGGAPKGQDSTFGSLTAKGGGGGGNRQVGAPDAAHNGSPGGSGGGATAPYTVRADGIQPQQPGDSGTYGFGNQGGIPNASSSGAGGGGAGAIGTDSTNQTGGPGGAGKQYDISGSQVYYAGGGGGGRQNGGNGGQGGQGGGADGGGVGDSDDGYGATANRGGGGGGGGYGATGLPHSGGDGGSGIVIVSY